MPIGTLAAVGMGLGGLGGLAQAGQGFFGSGGGQEKPRLGIPDTWLPFLTLLQGLGGKEKIEAAKPSFLDPATLQGLNFQKFLGGPGFSQAGAVAPGGFKVDMGAPGMKKWAQISPTDQALTINPDAQTLVAARAADEGSRVRAAEEDKARQEEALRGFQASLSQITSRGLDRLSEFDEAKRAAGGYFDRAQSINDELVAYSRSLPESIINQATAGLGGVMQMFEEAKSMGGELLATASMETAKYMDGIREGVQRRTETHKQQVAAEMQGRGSTRDEIRAEMQGIDFEMGDTLLATSGAIAQQQNEHLQQVYSTVASVVGSAANFAQQNTAMIRTATMGGLQAAGELKARAAQTASELASARSATEAGLVVAKAQAGYLIDAMQAQGEQFSANFMASIKSVVPNTLSVFGFAADLFASLLGAKTAAEAAELDYTLGMVGFETEAGRSAMNRYMEGEGFGFAADTYGAAQQQAGWDRGFGGIDKMASVLQNWPTAGGAGVPWSEASGGIGGGIGGLPT